MGRVLRGALATEDLYTTLGRAVRGARSELGIGQRSQNVEDASSVEELNTAMMELLAETSEPDGTSSDDAAGKAGRFGRWNPTLGKLTYRWREELRFFAPGGQTGETWAMTHRPPIGLALAVGTLWVFVPTAHGAPPPSDLESEEATGTEVGTSTTARLTTASGVDTQGALAAGARLDLDLTLAHLSLSATRREAPLHGETEIEGAADLLFLVVHQARMKRGSGQQELLGLGGIGIRRGGEVLDLGISLGGLYYENSESQLLFQAALGGYLGGHARLRVGRVETELRGAGYVTLAVEPPRVSGHEITAPESVVDSGYVLSGRVFYEAASWDALALGPELRGRIERLPDGVGDQRVALALRGELRI